MDFEEFLLFIVGARWEKSMKKKMTSWMLAWLAGGEENVLDLKGLVAWFTGDDFLDGAGAGWDFGAGGVFGSGASARGGLVAARRKEGGADK